MKEHRRTSLVLPRNRRGQALVEFVLIAPILLLLIIGMIEFARAFNMQQTLADAAREGARLASVYDPQASQTTVSNAVRAKISAAGFDASAATITFYRNGVANAFATGVGETSAVRVQMPYRFRYLRRLMALAYGGTTGTVTLSSTAQMRHE